MLSFKTLLLNNIANLQSSSRRCLWGKTFKLKILILFLHFLKNVWTMFWLTPLSTNDYIFAFCKARAHLVWIKTVLAFCLMIFV